MKRRIAVLCLIVAAIGIGVVICLLHTHRQYVLLAKKNAACSVVRDVYRAAEENYLFSDEASNVFELRKNGRLLMWGSFLPQSVACTDRAFPVSQGVAYLRNGALCLFDGSVEMTIAEDVVCACWDGRSFVWLSREDGAVYCLRDGIKESLPFPEFEYSDSQMVILATEQYVLITPVWLPQRPHQLLVYHRATEQTDIYPVIVDKYDACFLADSTFFSIGEYAFALDLQSREQSDLNLGIVAEQGTVLARAVNLQEQGCLYLSVCSKPELPWFYNDNYGTFQIDLRSLDVLTIDDQYYPNIFWDKEQVFGIKGNTYVCLSRY